MITQDIPVEPGYPPDSDAQLAITVLDTTSQGASYTLKLFIDDRSTVPATRVLTITGGAIAVSAVTASQFLATVTITAAQNLSLTPGHTYYGSLWRTDAGNQRPLWRGKIPVTLIGLPS